MSQEKYNRKVRKVTGSLIKIAIVRTFKQILMVDLVRFLIAYPRFFLRVKIFRKLRVFKGDTKDVNTYTIPHNLAGLKNVAVIRSNQLIRPLSIIDPVYHSLEKTKILTIGPRSEGEILNLVAYGFSLKNIRGLDLISYSPWIDIGDMHNMPYKDDSFNVLVNGFCIEYSENYQKAANEMLRVVKDGGILAIGFSHTAPKLREKIAEQKGYKFTKSLHNLDHLYDLFKGHIDHIYFSQDLTKEGSERGQNLLAIFSIKK
jgi:SAM-dependent methyltransferase